ncbi:hypothetical protein ONS95_013663 [Cadophora gregata]|uniref:uncharacterized protein n=1 Tax=Cadophora gregata TaxID=51156 RepID=UPI0026DD6207|nr:uncharacterized protein ONS95_013663 [Cadophora gregata]KAK0114162.1 hypothetical protein ONS95_013663 [Cadophora gregata]
MADHTGSAMKDFQTNLASCTELAACKRPYIRATKWRTWLKSKVSVKVEGKNYETTQVSRLLDVAYRHLGKPTHPINRDHICHPQHECLLIFSILLELGQGSLIHQFLRRDSVDKHLPFKLYELRNLFRDLGVTDPEQAAANFDKLQWKYCPAKLDFHGTRQYPENRIMPFCRRKRINLKGGTAQLWKIAVLEEFVEEKLRKAVEDSRFDDGDGLGPRYEFALKSFEDGNKQLFLNEKEAFFALNKQSAMVQFLGAYGHEEAEIPSQNNPTTYANSCEGRVRPTHNIILEFGENDLEEYFAGTVPPYLQAELDAFWRGLFVVAEAVKSIHNLTIDTDGRKEEFSGWHADIKPDNILLVHGKFKLADPGFMKVVRKTGKEPVEALSGGTETFGAPERCPGWTGTPSRVHQTIDTWSLGCVFSIAATWVVLGYQGIRQYNKIRKMAIKKVAVDHESAKSLASSRQHQKAFTTHGDHFHDGSEVLSAVLNWHTFLRNAVRKNDAITSRVLDLVEQKMLLGDAKSRIKAAQTCDELERILKEAERATPIPSTPKWHTF